jgi:hypothetical protein
MEKSLTELLIPNFLNFLKEKGEVSFIDKIPEELESILRTSGKLSPKRAYYKNKDSPQMQYGERHIILLDGEHLGFIDTYENPGAIEYEGEVPGFKTEDGGEIICLRYCEEANFRGEKGRLDYWKGIPFP